MSLNSERVQIGSIVTALLDDISSVITSGMTDVGTLRQRIGWLRSFYLDALSDGTFATKLAECFDLAYALTPTVASFVVIHEGLFAEQPTGEIAKAIVSSAIVMALATESKLISNIEFVSRDDIDKMLAEVKKTFDAARDIDIYDVGSFQALTALTGALVNHLMTTGRPLPRMMTFNMGGALPATVLSNRLYYSPDRWRELIDENKIVHPAFCPKLIIGLSR